MKRLLALVLCVMLLCGCSGAKNALGFSGVVKFADMEYVRPDMDEAAQHCQAAIDAAEEGTSADTVLEAVWAYYDVYNEFLTNYNLAYIHYHADLNDLYWQTEQEYCAEKLAQLDMYLEDIYYALAECTLRAELEEAYFGEGYFDSYEGEGLYDEELVTLLEQEQSLIAEYFELSAQAQDTEVYSEAYFAEYTMPMAQVLADLIAVRQEVARSTGYGSYSAFAWDWYYYRDYTPAQSDAYLAEIQEKLVPLYRELNVRDRFAPGGEVCTEEAVFDYVQTAAGAMGGVTEEAFRLLDQARLYNISASAGKSGVSFEVFLPRYYEPYVFVSGTGTRYDCLTFAHEFGHFAMDYAAAGSAAGTDVLEIFSQGMEYLSLCYADDGGALAELKLADCLCIYVEQAAYAAFEQEMYSLTGDDLTAQNLLALYEQICRSYGFDSMDWDPRDMITVPHFYTNPMYIISYVVSNDAALQLYQLELEEPGAGKTAFEENLTTEEGYFLAFLEEAGLESPFDRVDAVKALLESRLS